MPRPSISVPNLGRDVADTASQTLAWQAALGDRFDSVGVKNGASDSVVLAPVAVGLVTLDISAIANNWFADQSASCALHLRFKGGAGYAIFASLDNATVANRPTLQYNYAGGANSGPLSPLGDTFVETGSYYGQSADTGVVISLTQSGMSLWPAPTAEPISVALTMYLSALSANPQVGINKLAYPGESAPVAPVPKAPTVSFQALSPTSGTITVAQDGTGSVADQFALESRLSPSTAWVPVSTHVSPVFALTLLSSSLYEFRAFAINTTGPSLASATLQVATDNPAAGTWALGGIQNISGDASANPLVTGQLSDATPTSLAGDASAQPTAQGDLTLGAPQAQVAAYLGQVLYASISDLVARYGQLEIVQLTDRGYTGQVGAPECLRALADASLEADGFLGVRYSLPLPVTPPLVAFCCCEIARYRLYEDAAPQEVRQRYIDATTTLSRIAAGKVTLGISETVVGGATEPGTAGAAVITSPSDSLFGAGDGY
jgi:phage gp36-like protein